MLFVSTPSLAISLILAVFYLANLAFYAVNRQQDTDNAVETVSISLENERYVQHTVFLYGEDHTLKHRKHCDSHSGKPCILDFFAAIVERDTFPHSLPNLNLSVFDSGVCRKHFSRPPPFVSMMS
ncbi:MAG: hypothetical protein LBM08_07590 [Dysgonamonadaceae bacterium]|jgi:hypothetical protein|nr:hypothetical protein [Dysgonamonadaceae bacterium]